MSRSGLYLTDFNKEKGNNIPKKGMGRNYNEKIIIDCEESKNDTNKKNISKQNKANISFNLPKTTNENNNKKKKDLYKISKEYKEINDIYNTSIIDKTIQNAFYKTDENSDFTQ